MIGTVGFGVLSAREQVAVAFIRQWKVNLALYQQYGGDAGLRDPAMAVAQALTTSTGFSQVEAPAGRAWTDFDDLPVWCVRQA